MKRPRSNNAAPILDEMPPEQRNQIHRWVLALDSVGSPIQKSLERVADQMRCSVGTARRKYYDYRNSRDWRVLVNYAALPYENQNHKMFRDWWRNLCFEHKSVKAAYRTFLKFFNSNAPIPGMPSRRRPGVVPSGFGYDSLIRHAPTPFERRVFARVREQRRWSSLQLPEAERFSDQLSQLSRKELVRLIHERERRFSGSDLGLWRQGVSNRLRVLLARCRNRVFVREAREFADWLLCHGALKLFEGSEKLDVERLFEEILRLCPA